ncbi:triosephosphate isomerase, cytosolic-like, partial [Argentina anserina]|uniref:triosephosphate isomerase, cytosolic-like n=1 Tax=Argentina anserina TaxID=57926 RepID=UPI0021768CE2
NTQKKGRKFIVGGNWKCNGTTSDVKKIVTILNEAEVPSEDVVELLGSERWCFTGEISAEMLVNLGNPWVIIGHSERSQLLNESNEFVGDKVACALSQGLKLIACVGETLEQRESGSTVAVVAARTKAIVDKVSNCENIVLAYEPVWAIGTGKVATSEQAQKVHFELRKWLKDNVSAEVAASARVIYGGYVLEQIAKNWQHNQTWMGFWLAELPLSRSSLTLSSPPQ